ncbi:pyrroloquinoline quinone (PQQ) biosynthesis protein C [Tumebacillus sp. BK434]|uniref:TenA family transcriptional regulator n=1 Tax=Tumebacillus sp. BK434 TaxID=2512169 RepID=UPI0010EE024E|nr:iron-containing redox enzyme family protein [Tumebacillus sp. BK434]TCP52829.1 pyrroloquinoline quinone (PQQ) biosynthesis protein C [Tumebacillus sp. BK434]
MSQTMNDWMVQELPAFQTYREVEQAVLAEVEKTILGGRFLTTLHSGGFTAAQLREFALQYSYYSRNFPRVLGAAVAAVEPLDRWWVPLVDNMWDEAGRGNPKGYHSKMYRTFLESVAPDVAISDEHVPDYPVGGATKKAVESFLSFLKNATTLEAMAAVGLGSELFAGLVMGEIGQGLRHPNYNEETRVNVGFWMAHADTHEPRHYQLCKDVLLDFSSPEHLQTIYRAGVTIALSEARFYDELYVEMMEK